MFVVIDLSYFSGCGAVRLAHHFRVVGAAGSNPVIPTKITKTELLKNDIRRVMCQTINPKQVCLKGLQLLVKEIDNL